MTEQQIESTTTPLAEAVSERGTRESGGAPTKRKTSLWLIVLAVVGGLLAFCILACVGVQFYPRISEWLFAGQLVNAPAPDFTLDTLDGQPVTLSGLRDKPVVINFWATWCPSCVEELPDIRAAYHKHQDSIYLLAVNLDSDEEAVVSFAQEKGLDFPILFDENGTVADLYRVRGIPVTVFVDTKGILVRRHIGSLSQVQFTTYLDMIRTAEQLGQEKKSD